MKKYLLIPLLLLSACKEKEECNVRIHKSIIKTNNRLFNIADSLIKENESLKKLISGRGLDSMFVIENAEFYNDDERGYYIWPVEEKKDTIKASGKGRFVRKSKEDSIAWWVVPNANSFNNTITVKIDSIAYKYFTPPIDIKYPK